MPVPDLAGFAVLAANQDISFGPDRLKQAHGAHVDMRAELEKLRAMPLAFVGDVIEPGTAQAWLEAGGKSV